MWSTLTRRSLELDAAFVRLATLPQPRWTHVQTDTFLTTYFTSDIDVELATIPGFVYTPQAQLFEEADVIVTTAHGYDRSDELWNLRDRYPQALFAVWFWDNHLGLTNNLRTAAAADVVFASHMHAASTLANPLAPLGPHMPACTAQWSEREARRYAQELLAQPRQHRMLANYVDYPWSARSGVLRALASTCPEVTVVLMPPEDRSRYFGLSSKDRFAEWTAYKGCVILPIERDLSTRVFDALLAGQVPVIPHDVPDLDTVIAPSVQQALGIVRVASTEPSQLRAGCRAALQAFDSMGPAGVWARHQHALDHHLLKHRFQAILNFCKQVSAANVAVGAFAAPNMPAGLQFLAKAR